jgi:hypothetical protein
MCPACIASAAIAVGSVTTTGGISALLVKIFRSKKKTEAVHSKNEEQRREETWQRL